MPYSTVLELAAYMGVGDFGDRAPRAEVALDMAGDEVANTAPVPADALLLPDYERRAKNAEKLIAEFLLESKGFKTSESRGLGPLSTSGGFADMDRVRKMIVGSMGPFVGGGGSGVASVAVLSTFPSRRYQTQRLDGRA